MEPEVNRSGDAGAVEDSGCEPEVAEPEPAARRFEESVCPGPQPTFLDLRFRPERPIPEPLPEPELPDPSPLSEPEPEAEPRPPADACPPRSDAPAGPAARAEACRRRVLDDDMLEQLEELLISGRYGRGDRHARHRQHGRGPLGR
jgi:fused signal recognition particle receptor